MGARLYLEGTDEGLTIAEAPPVADGRGWWLRFREIGDRTLAEERLRDRYLEIDAARRAARARAAGSSTSSRASRSRSTTGEALGTIVDIYRAGGAEVFVVRGPRGEFDVPGVRGIVTELAPERGVMVVDLDSLALDARPVDDDDYVRPRDRRPKKQPKKRPGTPTRACQLPAGRRPRPRRPGRPDAAPGPDA